MSDSKETSAVRYRVDRFRVPEAARAEFLARILSIHGVLRELPGFRRDRLLEQQDGGGTFHIVTLVEWEDARAMASAKEAVAARYREAGFDAQAFLARLGIAADFGTYAEVARTESAKRAAFDVLAGCG